MTSKKASGERTGRSLGSSFERYIQDKCKVAAGGNYRSQARRFAEWAAGERGGDGWGGVVSEDADRDPSFSEVCDVATEGLAGVDGIPD